MQQTLIALCEIFFFFLGLHLLLAATEVCI